MLTKNEKEKLKYADSKRRLNEEAQLWFDAWMKKNVKDEPFKVCEDKKLNLQILMQEILKGKMNKPYAFAKRALKTYYPERKDEIAEYVNFADLKINKPIELIVKFVNEYIVEGEPWEYCNKTELNNRLSALCARRLKEVFGNLIYVNLGNFALKYGADGYTKGVVLGDCLEDLGYVKVSNSFPFFISKENCNEIVDLKNCQEWLLEMYQEVTENYIKNLNQFILNKLDVKKFDNICLVIQSYLNNVEKRLSKKSLNSKEFKECKKAVIQFFEVDINKCRKLNTKEGFHGEMHVVVLESFNKIANNSASQEDLNNIKNFYKHCLKVYQAMTTPDENGKTYPENYFALTTIMPRQMISMLGRLQKCTILNQEQVQTAGKIITTVRKAFTFGSHWIQNAPVCRDLKDVLINFKGLKCSSLNYSYDLSNERNYKQFVEKVKETVECNKLQNSDVCVQMIGRKLLKGENPINLNVLNKDSVLAK